MKFSIKDFFSKCDQIRSKLRIWSHLLKESLMENFIFCAVSFINSYINYSNIAWVSTNKTKLKKTIWETKTSWRVSYLIKTDLRMRPLLNFLLNALNVYQINLFQVLLFMHKIKTTASSRIFLCNLILQKT